jgi:lysophospholipase L1-like esterase
VGEEGVLPWRIPAEQKALFEPGVIKQAACPAGVRLAFVSDTSSVELAFVSPAEAGVAAMPAPVYDLVVDGALHQRIAPPDDVGTIRFSGVPAGTHRIELYLPSQYVPVRLRSLAVDGGASVEPWIDTRPRWVTYGSSITHCRHAAGPSETWPAVVAARCDLNHTNLGYGGNCHLEPMVARMIRDLPADYITLKLGINTHSGSLSDRTFRAAVLGVIATIRDGHPTTPLAVVSPIYCARLEQPEAANAATVGAPPAPAAMPLALMRQRIAEAVDVLRGRGDANLHYVDGLSLFGEADAAYLGDQVHPDADGYRLLGRRFADRVMPLLGVRT